MNFTYKQRFYIACVKRPIGFLGALLALIVTSPILLGTMGVLFFANKSGLKGIFFTQDRPGKNEKIFKVLKFKTMTDERDAEGNLLPDADRLTKVGRFVRKTSIDELPQLINILKGEMAFIGPRPLLVKYLPYYTGRESIRHSLSPGISGWAQVNGRNSISWDVKLEYDAYYVEHVSLFLDLRIFVLTIINVMIGSDIQVAMPENNDLDVVRSKR